MYKTIKVSEFLHRFKEPVELEPEKEYSLVTIRNHHKGVVLRNKTKGKLIGSKMYRIYKGQFIVSGIDARNGAFGIVPDELDGAIVTNDFWCFNFDETKVKRDFFYWLTNTPLFLNACIKSSQGVTQRIRLQRELFFNFEFRFPPLEEQENFLKKIQHADQGLNLLRCEINNQQLYITKLKQAILQEAISGQLTAEWRKQNPIQKGNPDTDAAALLTKIKAEKQQLIADGKLKKEKPLPEISPDEIPFSLPDSWVWCRLGEICDIKGGKRVPNGYKLKTTPTPYIYIRVSDMKNGTIDDSDLHYIDEEVYQGIKKYTISKDDLYMTIVGATIGKCGLVPEKFDGMNLTENAAKIILFLINKIFLWYCLDSSFCQAQFINKTKQVAVQKMAINRFSSTLIPLPPLAEQKAIVEKVDYLMKIIDQLEAQIKHRKQLAEELMQTVLREAFQ